MNFDEIRKKHGLGTKEEEETKEKTTSTKMSYSEIAKKHGVSFDVDENYLNDFIKSANEFSSVDEDSAYAAWNRLGLGTKASEVRGWLYHNKSAYSADDYKSLSDTVDSFVNLGSYFSNWDTEEAYLKSKKEERDYTEKLNFNLEEGQREIDALQNDYNAIVAVEQQISQITQDNQVLKLAMAKGDRNSANKLAENEQRLATLNKALEDAYNKYGGKDKLSATISQKQQYYTLASRAQKGVELSSVVGNEDFSANSKYQSTEFTADNVWEKLFHSTEYDMGYDDLVHQYINGDEEFRAEVNRKHSTYSSDNAFDDGESRFEEMNLDQMNETEISIYNYYYNTAGKEKAEEYLDSIKESLNYRSAANTFKGLEDKTLKEMLFGVYAGLDQFKSGLESLLSNEDYIVSSDTQMASGMVREDLADNGAKLPEWMGGASVGQLGYDMVTTTSNMLPSIMASAVANAVAPGSGAVVGAGLLGASASGNAYAEMLNLGYDKGQARSYALLVGASEAGLQYALGGIGKLGGKLSGNAISKFVSQFDNAIARTAIKLGGNMASEGLEEAIQSVLEPLFKSMATGDEFEGVNWEEVIYSGLMGALSAGILESGRTISSEVNTYQQGKALKETGTESVDRLVSLGQTFSADTVAYQLAGKVNENTGAYTIGRLLNEVGATLSEQNKTDIANALVGKGMTEADAKTISKWLGKAVDGGYFTKGQIAALESNEVISSVFQDVIINQNSTVNQRVQGYNESLHALAQEMSRGKATKATEAQQTPSEPTAMLSDEEVVRRIAEATGEDATAVAHGFTRKAETSPVTENTPVEQNATEGEFKASQTGKAKIGGTEVSIKEIASIKDGEMILRLEDDSTVNANDVEYGSSAEALIYENVVDMNLNAATANAFVKGYDPSNGMSAQEYVLGFREAYRYGEYGFPMQEMSQNGFSAKLSQTQRNLAYDLGKTDMKYKVQSKQEKIASTSANNSEKIASKGAKKGRVHYAEGISTKGMTQRQKASVKGLERLAEALGVEFHIFESEVGENGKRKGANGWFDPKDGSIHIDLHAGLKGEGTILFTASHELTHFIREWSPAKFKVLADFLLEQYGQKGISVDALVRNQIAKAKRNGRDIDFDTAYEEVIADSCESMLADGDIVQKLAELKAKDKTLWEKIKSFITDLVAKIKAAYAGLSPDSIEGRYVAEMLDVAERLKALWSDALVEASEASLLVEIDAATESVSPMFSERTWTESEYVTEREKTAKAISKALGVDIKTAYKYIDDINSVARLIADDRVRLDYDPNLDDNASVLKPNSEYKYTVDMSTLCAKRLLFTGTFDAIQKALPNTVFDSEDIVSLREMMQKRGYEVACGICYVESTRREIGRITQEFIDRYKVALQTGKPISRINSSGKEVVLQSAGRTFSADKNYTPNLGELNTTDIDIVKRDHREVYDAYLAFMNARGQAKPKLLETRAEYKGEILKHFKAKSAVKSRNDAGGLRLQSFSDFEVPHLIDMMQIVMDMSRVGLKSQAYTKVPAFAEVFGNTGVKINLSLIAKGDGLDANGNLVFDDVEGINHKEAFALRDKYSKNVGTILVGKTDAHIIAAMADPRIDYIIPFHKSSWKESLYDALGLTGYADYTETQNEKPIDKDRKIKNFDPSAEYWDFTKSGDENAQIYLEKCREDGRIPKFPQFQGYPGYWKLLIDFKMYDNDGVGSPQEVVRPIFNTEASERILRDYKGGHKSFPVAKDIVEDFVKEHEGQVLYSDRDPNAREFSDADIKYSIREEEPPKNTMEGYKVFVVKNGKLYPPMVANPNAEDTPVGVWLNADVGTRAPDSKTGRMQVKAGGKGTQGGSGSLAFRPGWHLGETPLATQFDRLNPETGVKELFPENFVWALCDIAADHDYQEEAMSYGYTKNGKFQHSLAGLPKLPTDGYYKYRTNPNPDTVPWLITGAMKVKKLLSDAEVNAILAEKGLPPKQRVGGDKTLADLGLSQYEGKLFSDRDPDSFSNRSLLANALESVAQNDIERAKLAQYKGKLALIEAEQAKLAEVKKKANEIRFTKGRTADETKRMKDLDFEANQIANRINTYDRQLLNLESTKALKGVLEREKKMAYKKAEQKGRDALKAQREKDAKTQRELLTRYQDARKKGVEGRRKTEMRHKIKNVVDELNQYLLKGTKDKHVPIQLQKAVAEALDAVNMDTVGAEERLANIHKQLEKDPMNHDLLMRYKRILDQGNRMDEKLQSLKNAYDDIVNSDDPLIANSHDDVISNSIARVIKEVGNTPLRDMSLSQLEEVYDMYRMVLSSIRKANKAFKVAKGEEISTIANGVIAELMDMKRKSPYRAKAMRTVSEFDWNNLKPVYAFERIGSANFTKVFNAVRAGEDAWAVDITEAKEFSEAQRKKYNYDSWDFKQKYSFETKTGESFELDLGEIMSLYAYAKDDHAKGHLTGEGFVFDPKKEVVKQTKSGLKVTYNVEDATSYNITEQVLGQIIGKLTPEQRGFADAMQEYLSTTMGEKGNEVSLALYEVKLFKNKDYFPLKVSHAYMAVAKEKAQGDVKIKNKGFTKDRKEGAKNPIVLTSFMDVWADHVNEMSMYHAFTLPLEDFYRVFNYKAPGAGDFAPVSVNGKLIDAHGDAAVAYIEQLLKDLNGGARVDPTAGIINKMMGLFKKSAVFASASVVIQQPSAIARATALVDAKYFIDKPTKGKHKETWAEVKKYAPIAIIKEMGYFDTGMGQSTVEWIKDEKTLMDKVDDIASKAPALADEYAWCAIWNAVKRETLHTYKHLAPNSDAFLKVVGERFTEVITKTQVYDSVLSRSGNMRSKDTGMKMATAFMGEPTTSINMIEDALTKAKRGNKTYARKAIGAVAASMILNSILVSIVYAGRDDDEDKTYTEKYIGTLTEELLDSFNPLTLIPFVKDIVSIVQGYDVERSDMAVVTDIIKAWKNLGSDNRTVYRKVEDFAGAIASVFGLPVKNIMRDARAMYNTVNSFINGEKTTGAGIKNALTEAVTGKGKTDGQQLYEAMLKGDTAQIERVKGRFKDDTAITSAIRTALRDNDSRIKAASKALRNGDIKSCDNYIDTIVAEGHFDEEIVSGAIRSEKSAFDTKINNAAEAKIKGDNEEYKKIVRELRDSYRGIYSQDDIVNLVKKAQDEQLANKDDEDAKKEASRYKVEDYFTAIVGRDQASAYVVKEDIIKTAMANGKDRDEAEADFNSNFASHLRDEYEDGMVTDYEAVNMLVNYGGRTQEGAEAKVQYWAFKKKYPDYDLSEDAVTKYYSDVEPSGIGIDVYYDYYKQRGKCKGVDLDGDGKTDSGSVKREVLEVINSLPITYQQKDALYYLNGWSASTIWEAPWH